VFRNNEKIYFIYKKKMPYVKRKRARSMPRRRPMRRRFSRKKRRTRKMSMYKRPSQYSFKIAWDQDFINGATFSTLGAPQNYAIEFNLSQLLNIQDYIKLFERVQVNCITFQWQVARTEVMITDSNSSTPAQPQGNIPQLLTRLDFNSADSTTYPDDDALIEAFREYGNTKTQLVNQPFNRKWAPRRLEPFYGGLDGSGNTLFGYSTGKKKPWFELNTTQAIKGPLWPALHVGITSDAVASNSSRFYLRPVVHFYVTFAGKRN